MKPVLRRLLGLGLLVAALGIGASLDFGRREPAAQATRKAIPRHQRSVLVVTVDTTRADHLEPYGAQNIATPAFTRLAREGVLFESATAVAPITLVAHTSIMSGLDPPQHGVRNNGIHYVPQEVTTLAERLRAAGYRTAAFVSAAVLERRYGLDQGFEVYDDDLSKGRERHPRVVPDRPAEATVDAALAWLDSLGPDERFFAWVHFYDPHAAYSPPPPYRDQYRDRLYDGEIAYMDSQLGRLLQDPRLAAGRDVVVSVIGDHGESLGEHGEQTHALLAYDATLHVPWLLRISGGPAGFRVARPVSQIDLVPTICDLLGVTPPQSGPGRDLQGQSLLPVLEQGKPPQQRVLYSETYLPYYTYGWAKLKVARQGSLKYVDAPTPELYDLRRDPRELSNLFEQQPGRAHDLQRDLGELLAKLGSPERETNLALDSEATEKLRSLGYLAAGSQPAAKSDGERADPKDLVDLHVGLERARRLVQDGLFEEAVRQLRAVLARDPRNLAAMIDLASALEQKGEVEEAVAVATQALAIDPRYPRLYLVMAGLEARRGDRAKALQLIETALGLDPRFLEAAIQKAYVLRQLGRSADLEAVLGKALSDFPGNPQLGAVYAQLVELPEGDLEAAEKRLREAIARDPFLLLGWRLLGETLERSNRSQEAAAEAYARGLARQPDDADLHARLGLLLARTGGGQETEAHLREAIRLGRDFRSELHVALGGWLAEHGSVAAAQREYEQVLAEEPRHPGARNNQAIADYMSGKVEKARQDLEALVKEYPRHADAHNNLAAIAIDRRDWRVAEKEARVTLQLDARQPDAWNNLGVACDELGQQAAARDAFEHALELQPSYWRARFNLGVALRKSGRAEEAAAALREVVSQAPNYSECHLELGDLYAGPLRDPAQARLHYNAFLHGAPADPRAAEVRRRLAALPPTPARGEAGAGAGE